MNSACRIVTENRPENEPINTLSNGTHPWKDRGQYVQMQQSEKPDLGTGFLSVSLDAAGALAVASDLSCRNALVLTAIYVKQGNSHYSGISHVLECISGSLPLATISTRIRTHL
jgi:hypothetical protein